MVEISLVIPCLNEEPTVGICIDKALEFFKKHNLEGEVIVVDNDSQDQSAEIARQKGARVVFEKKPGYGSAYLKGFREAKGKYIIMGDADNTYDFSDIQKFLTYLKDGRYDFVTGSRFKGKIFPGAMPWIRRYIGNPLLTGTFNLLFHANFSDVLSGFKALTNDALNRMLLENAGMEFTAELMAKAVKANLKIKEIPIIFYPRVKGTKTKLRSFRDGWRYLRFMFLYAPR